MLWYIFCVYYVVSRIKESTYCILRVTSVSGGFDGGKCSLTCYFNVIQDNIFLCGLKKGSKN